MHNFINTSAKAAPVVQILGPWLKNKGDELMLRSVVARLSKDFVLTASGDMRKEGLMGIPSFPSPTSPPTRTDLRNAISRRSVKEIVSIAKRGLLLPLMPERIYRRQNLVNARRMVALLDCSGFAYGDQWTPVRMIARTHYYKQLKERGVRLIMLPQALGPFENPQLQGPAREMFALFDRIFARDECSQQHVLSLGVPASKVAACPDITHLLEPAEPAETALWAKSVAIVPNARMLDKTEPEVAHRYLEFLAACIDKIRSRDLQPVIIIHETNDDRMVDNLFALMKDSLPVFDEDGITSKGLLRSCYANIGSRYHSLVSSLSQATPTLGTFWSHKYNALFKEYGSDDCLLSPAIPNEELSRRLDHFLSPGTNADMRVRLATHAATQKAKVETMWQEVETTLNAGIIPSANRRNLNPKSKV